MSTPMPSEPLSDEQLRRRTRELVSAAARLSAQLQAQTEKLSYAIDLFNREYVAPIRKELGTDDDELS